ncbi:hypothetical protein BHM03_00003071 [Ensete ventricosum]|nr:hypothetical protein BHM03_00003071 [Ensete ventricosum]
MSSGSGSSDDDPTEEEEEDNEGDDAASASCSLVPSPTASASAGVSSARTMTTISRHYFGGDSSADDHVFFIDIIEISFYFYCNCGLTPQNMREDYGMFVWPCSKVLAEYIWQQRSRFSGVSVVEVLLPLQFFSDCDDVGLQVLDNMKRICDFNKLNCEVNFNLIITFYVVLAL